MLGLVCQRISRLLAELMITTIILRFYKIISTEDLVKIERFLKKLPLGPRSSSKGLVMGFARFQVEFPTRR